MTAVSARCLCTHGTILSPRYGIKQGYIRPICVTFTYSSKNNDCLDFLNFRLDLQIIKRGLSLRHVWFFAPGFSNKIAFEWCLLSLVWAEVSSSDISKKPTVMTTCLSTQCFCAQGNISSLDMSKMHSPRRDVWPICFRLIHSSGNSRYLTYLNFYLIFQISKMGCQASHV